MTKRYLNREEEKRVTEIVARLGKIGGEWVSKRIYICLNLYRFSEELRTIDRFLDPITEEEYFWDNTAELARGEKPYITVTYRLTEVYSGGGKKYQYEIIRTLHLCKTDHLKLAGTQLRELSIYSNSCKK